MRPSRDLRTAHFAAAAALTFILAALPAHGPIAELAEYADGDVWRLA